jgi:ribosomal protein S18 acetylase RimI-like enzyme
MKVELRPATTADRDFLVALYGSTRQEELRLAGWDEQQERAFVLQQFTAQDAYYREHYPGATFDIVERDGLAVGRLYVHRRPTEIRLMDVTLSPDVRGQGIGSQLLRALMNEAECEKKTLSIHVEIFNPARRLYERLGFVAIEDRGVYHLLSWSPPTREV